MTDTPNRSTTDRYRPPPGLRDRGAQRVTPCLWCPAISRQDTTATASRQDDESA